MHGVVSRIQWQPFWLATQLSPQNDWTGWQNGVNDDVWAWAPFSARPSKQRGTENLLEMI